MGEERLHVVFGTGQVGSALIAHLASLDVAVRAVSRHRPRTLARGADWRAVDATDPEAATDAAKGASVVYQCLNAPYNQWPEQPPVRTNQPTTSTTRPEAASAADLTPTAAWSRRVRRIGGLIQAAFAAFWLARASLTIGGPAGDGLIAVSVTSPPIWADALALTALAEATAGLVVQLRPAGRSGQEHGCHRLRSPRTSITISATR